MSREALLGAGARLHALEVPREREVPVDFAGALNHTAEKLSMPIRVRMMRRRIGADLELIGRERERLSGSNHEDLRDALLASASAGNAEAGTLAVAGLLAEEAGFGKITPAVDTAALAMLRGQIAILPGAKARRLARGLAAVVSAVPDRSVHVLSRSDAAAAEDHAALAPLYRAAGLTSAVLGAGSSPQQRRTAYGASVLHAPVREVAFDHLRDRILLGSEAGPVRLMLEGLSRGMNRAQFLLTRGLRCAILDEADALLIDEACTPLVMSGEASEDPGWVADAVRIAESLQPGVDFTAEGQGITLTKSGAAALEEAPPWRHARPRRQAVECALLGVHVLEPGRHYVVTEGAVVPIDPATQQPAPGRSLGDGLQQVVEAREDVELTARRETRARTTYLRFLNRYRMLSAASGGVDGCEIEVQRLFGLRTFACGPRGRYRNAAPRIARTRTEQADAIAEECRRGDGDGKRTLVLARETETARLLAELLEERNVEVEAVTEPCALRISIDGTGACPVLVATGVCFLEALPEHAAVSLRLIAAEPHENRRLDGRILARAEGDRIVRIFCREDGLLPKAFGTAVGTRATGARAFDLAQRILERRSAEARLLQLVQERRRDEQLAYTGTVDQIR